MRMRMRGRKGVGLVVEKLGYGFRRVVGEVSFQKEKKKKSCAS